MSGIFEALKNFFANIIANEAYLDIISIFVTAIISYRVAKYSASKPNKILIKQKQLSEVYLPLFRIFEKLPSAPARNEIEKAYNDISAILDNNYELVFPQLHKLNALLATSSSNKKALETLRAMSHQVNTDYELLKKALGYPSENFYGIFVRMTTKQKVDHVMSWVDVILLFLTPVLTVFMLGKPSENMSGVSIVAITFACSALTCTIMIVINNLIKKMKD